MLGGSKYAHFSSGIIDLGTTFVTKINWYYSNFVIIFVFSYRWCSVGGNVQGLLPWLVSLQLIVITGATVTRQQPLSVLHFVMPFSTIS